MSDAISRKKLIDEIKRFEVMYESGPLVTVLQQARLAIMDLHSESEGEAARLREALEGLADKIAHYSATASLSGFGRFGEIKTLNDEQVEWFETFRSLQDQYVRSLIDHILSLSSHREDAETEIHVNLTHNDLFQLRSMVNDNGADAIIGLIRSWGIKDGRDTE